MAGSFACGISHQVPAAVGRWTGLLSKRGVDGGVGERMEEVMERSGDVVELSEAGAVA